MKDPYLIQGIACEIWDGTEKPKYPPIARFEKISGSGFLIFLNQNGDMCVTENYRPIGTEWDFFPKWVVCSTVTRTGHIIHWANHFQADHMHHCYLPNDDYDVMICPDKSRYEGEAWKNSLRMRPEWAR